MQMFSSQQDLQTNLEYIRKAGVAHMMTVYKTDNRVLHEVEEMDPGSLDHDDKPNNGGESGSRGTI